MLLFFLLWSKLLFLTAPSGRSLITGFPGLTLPVGAPHAYGPLQSRLEFRRRTFCTPFNHFLIE